VLKKTRAFQPIVGGAAGDGTRAQETWVGKGRLASNKGAAALHVFCPHPWSVGVDHGLQPVSARMTVTRAVNNVVYELDGKTAMEPFEELASAKNESVVRGSMSRFMITHEFGVHFFDEFQHARAPIVIGADGSITCAAAIPEGAQVSIISGEVEPMLEAARRAAQAARKGLGGHDAAAVLLFDCNCRQVLLGEQFSREIDVVRGEFPDVPIVGLTTYGEIARVRGKMDGWHNTTAVVVAIPA
jgi:methyl-accepting chemotaxis protein